MVEAHLVDAGALCEHFAWFEAQMASGAQVTEVDLDAHLTGCRQAQPGFRDRSFPTIAGKSGVRGAVLGVERPAARARVEGWPCECAQRS